jgi:hypothetical protein
MSLPRGGITCSPERENVIECETLLLQTVFKTISNLSKCIAERNAGARSVRRGGAVPDSGCRAQTGLRWRAPGSLPTDSQRAQRGLDREILAAGPAQPSSRLGQAPCSLCASQCGWAALRVTHREAEPVGRGRPPHPHRAARSPPRSAGLRAASMPSAKGKYAVRSQDRAPCRAPPLLAGLPHGVDPFLSGRRLCQRRVSQRPHDSVGLTCCTLSTRAQGLHSAALGCRALTARHRAAGGSPRSGSCTWRPPGAVRSSRAWRANTKGIKPRRAADSSSLSEYHGCLAERWRPRRIEASAPSVHRRIGVVRTVERDDTPKAEADRREAAS